MGLIRLSPHFALSEFRSPDRARVPSSYALELQRLCLLYLEPLREEFGPVVIHSGYRTPAHNAEVGGAPLSRHLDLPGTQGAAADLSCARGGPRSWFAFLDRAGIGGLGLYSDHVHADTRAGRARWTGA